MSAMETPAGSSLQDFVHRYYAMGERLYGVVDAARDRELAFAARDRFEQEIRWLFKGTAASHMGDVAPYLVPIAYPLRHAHVDADYLDLWAERVGGSVGILLVTRADPEALWTHLRELFLATDAEDHKYFFRFYDPRVLREYLPTCTGGELNEFFGPVLRILCDAARPGRMVCYRADHGELGIDERAVQSEAAAHSSSEVMR